MSLLTGILVLVLVCAASVSLAAATGRDAAVFPLPIFAGAVCLLLAGCAPSAAQRPVNTSSVRSGRSFISRSRSLVVSRPRCSATRISSSTTRSYRPLRSAARAFS